MSHPYFTATEHPRIIAHRGFVPQELAGRGIVENTHAAFEAAVTAGANYLESDCHLTSDGAIVLFHDDNLERVTGDPRKVADVTHSELAQIMSDRGGLLMLQEVLEEFPSAHFNIDVKASAAADPIGTAVAKHGHRVLLASFSDENRLRALRAAAAVPGAERPATSAGRGVLIRLLADLALGLRGRAAKALRGIDALQIPERQGPVRVLNPRLIGVAHASGVEVHVWTINDTETMCDLVGRGVDAIITDRTDVALAALR